MARTETAQQGPPGNMTIGAPVAGGIPNLFLYVDILGNLFQDGLASRNSVTFETHIGQDDGLFTSEHIVVDASGLGDWAAGLVRNSNLGLDGAIFAAINGGLIGSPDGAINFASFTDVTGNITGTQIIDSQGVLLDHDDVTSNTAQLNLGANSGAFLKFDNINTLNTFDNMFFITTAGIGWKDNLLNQAFFLPIVDGNFGDGLITDGAGNLSFGPVGGAMTIGAPVIGGTPKEVLYIDNAGNLFSDAAFYRDSVTNDFAIYNNVMEVGYGVGLTVDDVVVANSMLLSYFDSINTKGVLMRFEKDKFTNRLRDATVPGFSPDAGMQMDFTLPTKNVTMFYRDASTPNKSSEVRLEQNDLLLYHNYNLGLNSRNLLQIGDTSVAIFSDIIAPNSNYMLLDWTNQVYGIGDFSNSSSGLTSGLLDENLLLTAQGDVAGSQQGILVVTDNTLGAAFAAMGSVSGGGNSTFFIVDDTNLGIVGFTAGGSLLRVRNLNTETVSLGFGSFDSITTGTANVGLGYMTGAAITSGNDNIAIGSGALMVAVSANSNVAIGAGAMGAAINPLGNGLEDNIAIGREAGLNLDGSTTQANGNVLIGRDAGKALTTGIDNILIGKSAASNSNTGISRVAIGFTALATANYQVMFGGSGSPFTEFVFGGHQTQSGFAGHDVLLRTIFSNGTNIAGGDFNQHAGLSTGSALTGDWSVLTALPSGSGTTLNTTSPWIRLSGNGNIYLGDMNGVQNNTVLHVFDFDEKIWVSSRFMEAQNADIVAANDLNIGTRGNSVIVTGNTQINAINAVGWEYGSVITLSFTGTPTIKHNTAGGVGTLPMLLAGSVDLVAANLTNITFRLLTDGFWHELARTVA